MTVGGSAREGHLDGISIGRQVPLQWHQGQHSVFLQTPQIGLSCRSWSTDRAVRGLKVRLVWPMTFVRAAAISAAVQMASETMWSKTAWHLTPKSISSSMDNAFGVCSERMAERASTSNCAALPDPVTLRPISWDVPETERDASGMRAVGRRPNHVIADCKG